MFRKLISQVKKLLGFGKSSTPSRNRKARSIQLALEQLEGRIVPATLLWVARPVVAPATAANFTVAANWLNEATGGDGAPAPDDNLVFDPNTFVNTVPGTITNAFDDEPANFSFGRITLATRYLGEVSLSAHTNPAGAPIPLAQTVTLNGGQLWAPWGSGEPSDIVSGSLYWRGGTLGGNWQINTSGRMYIQDPGGGIDTPLHLAAQLTVC